LDGFIIVDKPDGITSHDVVSKLRKKLKIKRIGHTGTLDPIATGVLPICIGICTKASDFLVADEKIYEATIKLGVLTDTSDITGNIIEEKKVDIKELPIENVIYSFIGKQKQKPPIYSAVKVNGKKLYEYAREGKKVEIPEREIEIFDIKLKHIDVQNNLIDITVHCSKGTYIRSLCVDIGTKLGTIATMQSLRRIQSGIFNIDKAIKLDEINEATKLITLEDVFKMKKKIILKDFEILKLLNGVKLKKDLKDEIYRIYDFKNNFIGLGSVKDNYLKREIIIEWV